MRIIDVYSLLEQAAFFRSILNRRSYLTDSVVIEDSAKALLMPASGLGAVKSRERKRYRRKFRLVEAPFAEFAHNCRRLIRMLEADMGAVNGFF